MHAWPAERMKRSRSGQSGFAGLCAHHLGVEQVGERRERHRRARDGRRSPAGRRPSPACGSCRSRVVRYQSSPWSTSCRLCVVPGRNDMRSIGGGSAPGAAVTARNRLVPSGNELCTGAPRRRHGAQRRLPCAPWPSSSPPTSARSSPANRPLRRRLVQRRAARPRRALRPERRRARRRCSGSSPARRRSTAASSRSQKGTRVALHDQRPPLERGLTLREYVLSGARDLVALEEELRAARAGDGGRRRTTRRR